VVGTRAGAAARFSVNSLGQGWQLLTAAAFVSMALPMLVFFSLQRYFAGGLLAGSVKA
jgi:alpha-glucoside transport system permease protein